jgi:hypothetical protein
MTAVLAAGDEELYQPALRVLLVWWITLPYIFAGHCGLAKADPTAHSAVDDLGRLVTQLSILQWTSVPLAARLVSCATCWSRPFGYTSSSPTRPVGFPGELSAPWWLSDTRGGIGLQVVVLMLGGFNDNHLLSVAKRPMPLRSFRTCSSPAQCARLSA